MPTSTANRITTGIMLGLGVWGICLAIGATGVFVDESLFDPMRSGFVIFFVVLFLVVWNVILRVISARQTAEHVATNVATDSSAPVRPPPWSWPGVISVAFAGLGIAVWGSAIATWQQVSPQSTTILGWSAALLLASGVTAGMVALSQPHRRRGKWLGLVGMATCCLAIVVYVVRMR